MRREPKSALTCKAQFRPHVDNSCERGTCTLRHRLGTASPVVVLDIGESMRFPKPRHESQLGPTTPFA